jgi:hypothetical protein
MINNQFTFTNNKTNPNSNILDGKGKVIVGRVKNIFLNQTNDENLGAIEIQPIYPENQTTIIAYPFFPNTTSYPLLEEIVLCNKLPSEFLGISEGTEKYYYIGVVNIWNNPHVNFYPSPRTTNGNIPTTEKKSYQDIAAGSTIKIDTTLPNNYPAIQGTFKERDNIHPLQPYLGDTIYQGRFGNSIRLGSTASPTNKEWSSVGNNGDPITILRNGQPLSGLPSNPWTPITENINTDPSSIYLTSTQNLPIKVASQRYFSYTPRWGEVPIAPGSYSGNQVIINSGRLVFNSKSDHILLSSQRTISFEAVKGFNFDTPANFVVDIGTHIKLGSKDAKESIVKGNTLYFQLDQMLKALLQMLAVLKTSQIYPNGVPKADIEKNNVYANVETSLQLIQEDLESIKSKKVFTI